LGANETTLCGISKRPAISKGRLRAQLPHPDITRSTVIMNKRS
jgi:hypothetical protein